MRSAVGGSSSPAVNGPGAARRAAAGDRWSLAAGLERSCGADGSGLLAGPAPSVGTVLLQGRGPPAFRVGRLARKGFCEREACAADSRARQGGAVCAFPEAVAGGARAALRSAGAPGKYK